MSEPKQQSLAERMAALSPEQRRVLEARLAAREKPGRSAAMRRVAVGPGPFPLSFAQQRLWFLEQLEPGVNHVSIARRLRTRLSVGRVGRALEGVMDRHDALRTTFSAGAEGPEQTVHPAGRPLLSVADLRRLPSRLQGGELRRLHLAQVRRSFDLGRLPLFRVTLAVLADADFFLLVTMHHIVSDDWSIDIFFRELQSFYQALAEGRGPALPELPIQYADYAVEQRRQLTGERLKHHLEHWRRQLAGSPPGLDLPMDRPRPVAQTHRGAIYSIRLPSDLSAAWRRMSRQRGATLFVTFLAAFVALLGRLSGERDIVVGSPVAGRTREELEGLIGFFVNTLVLRADLGADPSWSELARDLSEQVLAAQSHQDLPFEKLVDELRPERSLERSPLFQVVFVTQKGFVVERRDGEDREHRHAHYANHPGFPAQFDLTLRVDEGSEPLAMNLEYNLDLFDPTRIGRTARQLVSLLEAIVAEPERPLSELPILGLGERQQLLREWPEAWSRAPETAPAALTLDRWFAARASETPERIAVTAPGEALSYGDLARRARRLARRLRGLGVGPEVRVGLLAERGPEMVVAILGILEAGGAYVPLDPAVPAERLSFLLEDALGAGGGEPDAGPSRDAHRASGPRVLVMGAEVAALPEGAARGLDVIDLGAEEGVEAPSMEGEGGFRTPLGAGPEPDHPAYVIYTSGSTGRPKGVVVTHRNVTRLLTATEGLYGFGPDDVWTLFHSYAFDFSVWEMWGALAYGGRLVVVPYLVSRDPSRFLEVLEEERVTVLNQTPSAFRQLLWAREAAARPGLPFLAWVIFGGEALEVAGLEPWWRAHGTRRPRLVNMYGITETTVHVTWCPLPEGARGSGLGSPVGVPLPDLSVWVVDGRGRPAPVGVPGEGLVGGPGLARGYLGRPGLTASRYVPDGIGGGFGERLYRSGDLLRTRSDGALEHLGRIDHQVKVRGFRIELGEIEAALAACAGVRESVVVVREDTPGDRRLAAYFVGGSPEADAGSLRRALAERLPEHMVPSAFVALPALPLTPNGKVDRRALPAPGDDASAERREGRAVEGSVETALAEIWAEVLGRGVVRADDNFFELGGDSILSIQVVSRAARRGLRISPRQMFQYQTLAELAAVASSDELVSLPQGAVTGEVRLSPVQRWFLERPPAVPEHNNQSLLVALRRPVPPAALAEALAAALVHHDALRLRFHRGEGGWRQECAPPRGLLPFLRLDLVALPPDEALRRLSAVSAAAQTSLDLGRGPLARAVHFTLAGDEAARLLLVVHHLAVDGVSWRILLEDLAAAAEDAAAGRRPALPPKTTSFRDWSALLAEHASSPALLAELGHWAAEPPEGVGRLPVDHPGGGNSQADAEIVQTRLSAEETEALLTSAPAAYRTRIDDLLLTALVRTLVRHTGRDAVRIDLEGHGREEIFDGVDLSRTVGWFTSIYPVLFDLGPAGTEVGAQIKAVKETLRAIPGRGLGYGVLRYLGPEEVRRTLAALPAAEVLFNYFGQLDQAVADDSPFVAAPESAGPTVSPRERRSHLLEVNALVADGRLQATWTYSRGLFREETAAALAATFGAELSAVVAHCLEPGAGGRTPSDFPLAGIDSAGLDRLFAEQPDLMDLYPASPVQEGMLFHSLYDPGSGAYCVQIGCRLWNLDEDAFVGAWQAVVDRHPVLRTSFVWEAVGERPLQVVHRRAPMEVTRHDLRGLEAGAAEERLAVILDDDRRRGFDLGRAPLMRLTLADLGDGRHHMVWTHHHLLLDGWCQPILFREVLTAYEAVRRGEEPRFESRRPYRDYVEWLEARDLDEARVYWSARLEGFTAPTPLGDVGAAAAREQAGRPGEMEARLGVRSTSALVEAGRRHRLTANTLVSAAWALVLARTAGQRDVVFGATLSGRPAELAGVEAMLGLFINTLPVRVRVDEGAAVAGWLGALQEQQAELRSHQHTPLAQVRRWSEVPAGQPLFHSILVFENYPVTEALEAESTGDRKSGGLAVGNAQAVEQTNYPLTLVAGLGSQLAVRALYDRKLFAPSEIGRLLAHFETALRGLAEALAGGDGARPGEAVLGGIDLLTAAERQQLLVEWPAARADVPVAPLAASTLHRAFERRSAAQPDAVAVAMGDEQLSYGALARRASDLAHRLRRCGAGSAPDGAEPRVGLLLERSVDLVVAVLGVLTAGAAYVPLDPAAPADRLAFLLADALEGGGGEPGLLVTTPELAAGLPAASRERLRIVPVRGLEPPAAPSSAPCSASVSDVGEAGPDHPAYVIYTSGSTGRPKGVVITHRNVLRLAAATEHWYGFGPRDVWPLFHSYAFDVSVWEMWGALLHGGRLEVVPYWTTRTPDDFLALLRERRVTVLNQTPTAFRNLLQAEGLRPGGGAVDDLVLDWVIFAGESLPPALLTPWWERFGAAGTRLINMYGITETTVHVTFRELVPADRSFTQGTPIGVPMPDLSMVVLDRRGTPVPIGVPGEIGVGGPGLARGYLKRPGLTAARYVPDAFSGRPGGRLYLSGDLARSLPDGELEHLGRIDLQVKVRGFRIELGEIESALEVHPAVEKAAVLARGGGADLRLVAYVVAAPAAEGGPDDGELRDHLGARLPDYMVPAAFVRIPELPLTVNGKLDRRALPEVEDGGEAAPDRPYRQPRPGAERELADIWAEVLRVSRVGADDDFFTLGGDSILSMQVVSRAARRGLRLTPRQIFQNPTVESLAAVVGTTQEIRAEQGPVVGPVQLLPIQRWLFTRRPAEIHHHNQALLLAAREAVSPAALRRAVAALLRHHDALRLRFAEDGPAWSARIAPPGGPVPFAAIDLSALRSEDRSARIEALAAAAQTSLDLARGPLLRSLYLDTGPEGGARLSLVVHHLAMDGVSWRVVLEDLAAAYRRAAAGEAISLPPKTTSLRTWAERLAGRAASSAGLDELPFWAGLAWDRVRPLPRDGGADAGLYGESATLRTALPAEVTEALLTTAPRAYRARTEEVLLTALARTLAVETGAEAVLVDLEGHGREEIFPDVDLTRTVGWLTSLYPMLLDLAGTGGDPGRQLLAVKEQLRALPGRGLGWGLLRYLAGPEVQERLTGLPRAEVLFNYLGRADRAIAEDSPFAPAPESAGPSYSPRQRRPHLLEVSAIVVDGRLEAAWTFSPRVHSPERVQAVAARFLEELKGLVEHCASAEAGGVSPADFPLAGLDEAALAEILSGFGGDPGRLEDVYPLSPLQEGLYVHALTSPGDGAYVMQLACRLSDDLDVAAFRAAWELAVERHPILRTGFASVERPLQVVHRRAPLPFLEEDWASLTEEQCRAQLAAYLAADRQRGFDLDRPPLMRLWLARLPDGGYRLVWSHHHLLLDGWCLPILFGEIFAAYRALADGETPRLPTRRPYRDYIEWLSRQDLDAAEAYWRRRLGSFTTPTTIDLPLRPGALHGGESLPGTEALALPGPAADALAAFARRSGLTVNTVVSGAWALLLSRFSHRRDVVYGATVSGRPADLPGAEGMLGLFINTLPVRVRARDDAALLPWLSALQDDLAELRAYEHTPLVELWRWSGVAPGTPLFHSILAFENYPVEEAVEAEGESGDRLAVSDVRGIELTHYPLALVAIPGTGLELRLLFDRARLEAATVGRLLGGLATLLGGMAEGGAERLGALSLLAPGERRQLSAWARPGGAPASEAPARLVDLLAAQVRARPDSTAVVAGDESLSYGELARRAGALAGRLRALGVGPESRVGLLMERSPELVVGLVGILAAGGAYVPLDPSLPPERLAYVLADSQQGNAEPLVVTVGAHLASLIGTGARPVCLDAAEPFPAAGVAEPGSSGVLGDGAALRPDHPAYVIYTSGSTGRPKGVVVTHRNVSRLLAATEGWFDFGEGDVWTLFHSYAFDFSVWELWGALAFGGRLVVVPYEVSRDPEGFLALLAERRVTVLNQTPSAFRQLVAAGEAPGAPVLAALEWVIFGGEALDVPALEPWWRRHGAERPRLVNMYGITETTVHVTFRPVGPDDLAAGGGSPIGVPIPDLSVDVADSGLRLLPVGIPGEAVVGGAGLARGYLGRPGLTAERFVPDPWAAAGGERLYRSGDLVRRRPEGELEHLGRIDHQVKVRGFRIELGEIEAALEAHPAVRRAVVRSGSDPAGGEARLVAYVVAAGGGVDDDELRRYLRERVPEYMVPGAFLRMAAIPLTVNGKLDTRALPTPEEARGGGGRDLHLPPGAGLEAEIAGVWKAVLGVERVGLDDNFFDLGGHSLRMVELQHRLRRDLGRDVPMLELFRHPTVTSLADFLEPGRSRSRPEPAPRPGAVSAARPGAGIAVVGLAGRFPGSPDVASFWESLAAGAEGVRFYGADELVAAGIDRSTVGDPAFVGAHGAIEDVDLFDAGFFGMTPREAQLTDPQQRLFLECAWHALEAAAIDPRRFPGAIGVYAGVSFSSYWLHLVDNPELLGSTGAFRTILANDKDYLPTRVSYKLDLRGPSVSVQTACSTSLVATHLACRALLDGECDLALAGGASVSASQVTGYMHEEGGILSPDGRCRAFDAEAGGTVGGSGVGIVVLRRLEDAVAAGDPIHAVIRGTAINNDGSLKVGFTAPSVEGQTDVLRRALAAAAVEPETVGYVEAHGTGTALGDPIEVAALAQAYGAAGPGEPRAALGSVKTNIGHLDAAAGVAGLIKTVLAVEHGQVPPSLHFTAPNPEIDFAATRFAVNAELAPWPLSGGPRRAAVSSFGIGGTNAHAIVEEAPAREPSGPSRPRQLFVVSARSESALAESAAGLARHLEAHPEASPADVAHTLQVGRAAFDHRRVVVADSVAGAAAALGASPKPELVGRAASPAPRVVYLLSGQGAQYPGMGRELYAAEAVFRDEVDACAELLRGELGLDLREVLFSEEEGEAGGSAGDRLSRTELAQPALFVVETALARLWESWGVRPAALLGHSVGELAAAHLAGVLSRESALSLVAARGRLMGEMASGSMLGLPLGEAEVLPLLGDELSLAAVNGPSRVVVSGPTAAVDALASRLAAEGVEGRRLHTSHAFHSSMMEPMLERFRAVVNGVSLLAPRVPWVSNLTGRWITPEEATDAEYWVRQVRSPVRFSACVETVLGDLEGAALLEVGPGRTLSTLVRQHPSWERGGLSLASLRHPRESTPDEEHVLTSLGRLWAAGVEVDWAGFRGDERRRRVVLPTYPFERRRYWVERSEKAARRPSGKRPDVADWFYLPAWEPASPPPPPDLEEGAMAGAWLVVTGGGDEAGELAEALAARLREAGVPAAVHASTPAPRAAEYAAALDRLLAGGGRLARVVHLSAPAASGPAHSGESDFGAPDSSAGHRSALELLALGQALTRRLTLDPVEVVAVTVGARGVVAGEAPDADAAVASGPLRVLPQEHPHLRCRSIDLDPAESASGPAVSGRRVERLLAEILGGRDVETAYRGGRRFRRAFRPLRLDRDPRHPGPFRPGGRYVLIGGLGQIGLSLAEALARKAGARSLLVGRSLPPAGEEAEAWLAARGPDHPVSRRILRLREVEAAGGEVETFAADAADPAALAAALRRARERFGGVDGIFLLTGPPAERVFRPFEETTPDDLALHLGGKAGAVRALEGAVRDELGGGELDFCLLFSSLAGVLGGLGFAAYAGANAYLDAFAEAGGGGAGEPRLPWVSVGWDGWLPPGESAGGGSGFGASVAELAMTHEEGIEALERVLLAGVQGRVTVSTGDLGARLERWLRRSPGEAEQPEAAAALHARPEVSASFVEPESESERRIAELWRELLGIEAVGVDDNFYELGGDSLLATQIISRLRHLFRVDLPMSSLFETPTVGGLAAALERGLAEGAEAARLEAILGRIETLSTEQVDGLLANRDLETTEER